MTHAASSFGCLVADFKRTRCSNLHNVNYPGQACASSRTGIDCATRSQGWLGPEALAPPTAAAAAASSTAAQFTTTQCVWNAWSARCFESLEERNARSVNARDTLLISIRRGLTEAGARRS